MKTRNCRNCKTEFIEKGRTLYCSKGCRILFARFRPDCDSDEETRMRIKKLVEKKLIELNKPKTCGNCKKEKTIKDFKKWKNSTYLWCIDCCIKYKPTAKELKFIKIQRYLKKLKALDFKLNEYHLADLFEHYDMVTNKQVVNTRDKDTEPEEIYERMVLAIINWYKKEKHDIYGIFSYQAKVLCKS